MTYYPSKCVLLALLGSFPVRPAIVVKLDNMNCYYKDANSQKGYVLIFTVFLLFSLGLSLAAAKPYLFFVTALDREKQTRQEIDRIVMAIKGDPKLRTFGYLTDMGRLPSDLSELNTQGSQASFHWTDDFFQVGLGWKGPYVTEPIKDSYLKDAWNNDYVWRIETVTVQYDPTDSTRTASW